MGVEMLAPAGRCCSSAPQGGQDAVSEMGLGWGQAALSWSNKAHTAWLLSALGRKGILKPLKIPRIL